MLGLIFSYNYYDKSKKLVASLNIDKNDPIEEPNFGFTLWKSNFTAHEQKYWAINSYGVDMQSRKIKYITRDWGSQ